MKLSGFKILPVLALLVAGFCMFSCAEEPRDGMPDRMPLVIEGWIEDGLRPVVIVTRAVDLTRPVGSLDDYVEKWCRVSIADGDRIYYLTGKIDKAYTPSFVFTTSRLHGVAGHTYHLKVETEDTVVEAETRIPASPVIDSLKVVKAGLADSLYQIVAYPHVAEDSPCYYKRLFKNDC